MTLEDLLLHTERNGECLEWTRCRSSDGYGSVWVPGKGMRGAHREVYQLVNSVTLPRELEVLHSCDNPPCINPDHLSVGTHADNMREMSERGRAFGHKPKKLTQELADEIRSKFIRTGPRRSNSKALSIEYGVSVVMIDGIARGRFWK